MAKNDLVLIDGIIDDRLKKSLPTNKRDEVFEYFVLEQLLKFADLSADEVKGGWLDGRDDGGIDGLYVFINDVLLSDPHSFNWPKGKADLSLWIINCKHHDTFKQETIDKLVATLSELLDLGKQPSHLQGGYSKELIKAREQLVLAYRTLATRISSFKVRVVYASRGDSADIGAAVKARAKHTEVVIRALFSNCDPIFRFVGASDLIALDRKTRRYSLELPFIESLSHGERYVLLSKLEDFSRFVHDEDGEVRRYLFDSNVRDFAGLNRVNEDIATSLQASTGPDFWWLNNGITVLVTKAVIIGKSIVLDDVQIVNGLQTTESIARYFAGGGSDKAQRAVLVKIIKTDDPAVRDAIIRATNNQTAVEQQSLHATDKIQRDVEQILLRAGWYYDRRKNYYANQGVPLERIVSPLYVAAAFVGIIKRHPATASKLRQKFMRSTAAYTRVFSEGHELEMWPRLVSLVRNVDFELNQLRQGKHRGGGDRFLKRWRYLVALITASRKIGSFAFSPKDFATHDFSSLSSSEIEEVWNLIQSVSGSKESVDSKRAPHLGFVRKVCMEAAIRFAITNPEAVESTPASYSNPPKDKSLTNKSSTNVAEELIDRVDALLPVQPWKPGVHAVVSAQLGCSAKIVSAAIQELIARGRRNQQKDGVVFDSQGAILATDPDRFQSDTSGRE